MRRYDRIYQYGCTCGAIQVANGSWHRLAGVAGVVQQIIVWEDGGSVVYGVSHGFCPECAAAYQVKAAQVRAEAAMAGVTT